MATRLDLLVQMDEPARVHSQRPTRRSHQAGADGKWKEDAE
jgi:hypothetical protein